jgi:hypothetical protein
VAGGPLGLDDILVVGFVDLRMRYLNSKNGLRYSKMETIFLKLKRFFGSNQKYFLSNQTLENSKIFFRKSFYRKSFFRKSFPIA